MMHTLNSRVTSTGECSTGQAADQKNEHPYTIAMCITNMRAGDGKVIVHKKRLKEERKTVV